MIAPPAAGAPTFTASFPLVAAASRLIVAVSIP